MLASLKFLFPSCAGETHAVIPKEIKVDDTSRRRVWQRIIGDPVVDLLRVLHEYDYEANWHVEKGKIIFENEPEVELLAQTLNTGVVLNWRVENGKLTFPDDPEAQQICQAERAGRRIDWHIADGKIVIDYEPEQPRR